MPTIDRSAMAPNPLREFGFYALLPFLFFLYSRLPELTAPSLHLPMLCGTVVVFGSLFGGGIGRLLQTVPTRLLLLYTVWLILAIPGSIWLGNSAEVLRDDWLRSLLILCATVAVVPTFLHIRKVLYSVAFGCVGASLAALAYNYTGVDGRLYLPIGELANPNALALNMAIGIPLAFFGVVDPAHGKAWKLFFGGSIPLMLYVILRTGSRGAIVALGIIMAAVFIRLSNSGRVKLILCVAALAVVGGVLMPGQIRDRFLTMFAGESMENVDTAQEESAVLSTRSRVELLKASINITLQHPLLGVGPGNFVTAYNQILVRETGRIHWEYTHNAYTQISSEMGLPALFFYAGALLSTIWAAYRVERQFLNQPGYHEVALAACVFRLSTIALAAAMMFGGSAYSFYGPVAVGIGAALTLAARTQSQQAADAPPLKPQVSPQFGTRPLPHLPLRQPPAGSPPPRFAGGRALSQPPR